MFSYTYIHRIANGTGSPDEAVTVTFHVLVPYAVWNWDEKSCIHLRFGHPKLGNWKLDHGSFKETRYVSYDGACCMLQYLYIIDSLCRNTGEGLYEMCCALLIDVKILQKDATIPYKYIIYSARRGEQGKPRNPHEWLHGADSRGRGVVNRCLRIPKEKVQRGGIVCIHSLIRTECN